MMIPFAGSMYRMTTEDERVVQALIAKDYMSMDETLNLLSVVNAGRAYERDRIIAALETLPIEDQVYLSQILAWLRDGAQTRDA